MGAGLRRWYSTAEARVVSSRFVVSLACLAYWLVVVLFSALATRNSLSLSLSLSHRYYFTVAAETPAGEKKLKKKKKKKAHATDAAAPGCACAQIRRRV